MQQTARTSWSSSSRARWCSASIPGLPEMLAVENAALHRYFESGLLSCRPSSPRSAASDDSRRAPRQARHVRRDATEDGRRKMAHIGIAHWLVLQTVWPICTYTILPGPERLKGYRIRVCTWLALLVHVDVGPPVLGAAGLANPTAD